MADTTTTGALPSSSASMTRLAMAARPSGVATDVPPNFMTMMERSRTPLLSHQLLEADHEPLAAADPADREENAGHEARAVDRVVSDGQRLALSAEEDLLMRDQPGQSDRVD